MTAKNPPIRIRGARSTIPPGTVIGRTSKGDGELEVCPIGTFLSHPAAQKVIVDAITVNSSPTTPGGENGSLQYNNSGVFSGTNITFSSPDATAAFLTADDNVNIIFQGGQDTGYGGGSVAFLGGNDAGNGAGDAVFNAGQSNTDGIQGGNINLSGGDATIGNANGGDLNLSAGVGSGTGKNGKFYLQNIAVADPGTSMTIWSDNGTLVQSGFVAAQSLLSLVTGDSAGLVYDPSYQTIGVPIGSGRATTRLSDYLSQGSGAPVSNPNIPSGSTALYLDATAGRMYFYDLTTSTWVIVPN